MNPSAVAPHSDHVVQLFDAARSRADGAARFLADGCQAGGNLLIIATRGHWELIATHLERRDYPVRDAALRERVQVIDAHAVLRRMRRRGVFQRDASRQVISEIVADAAGTGRSLWAYGETVDLLAEEGSFDEACIVEHAWNAALAEHPARLLCGYSAAHFADPRHASWLRAICDTHARVHSHSADALGTWLTSSLTPAGA